MRDSRVVLIACLVQLPWVMNVGGLGNWVLFVFLVATFWLVASEEAAWEAAMAARDDWLDDIEGLNDRHTILQAKAQGHKAPPKVGEEEESHDDDQQS